jgi:hypothetical protein
MFKYDVINRLIRAHGFTRYLNIRTGFTGRIAPHEPDLDEAPLTRVERIAYRCGRTPKDPGRIDRTSRERSSHGLVRQVREVGGGFDIAFVDPWHTYASTSEDLHGALSLLAAGGVIVVHDCLPRGYAQARPRPSAGGWCGETYAAFIDFACTRWVAAYCTVDCDFGCGVLYAGDAAAPAFARRPPSPALIHDWRRAGASPRERWAFFEQNRTELLNLVTPEAFAAYR